jgi:hypothetical protein
MSALARGMRRTRVPHPHRLPAAAGLVLMLVGAAWTAAPALGQQPAQPQPVQTFPHQRHEGLFPLCTGCHQGIPTGDTTSFFPSPQVCARCHNGSLVPPVNYTPPALRHTNLKFHHDIHPVLLQVAGDSALACEACHSQPGGTRMEVTANIQLSTCFSCHAHKATQHQVDAKCTTCHVPLARSGFSLSQIEAIKPPPDHAAKGFLAGGHGVEAAQNAARCATCHTRERCASCHVDADRTAIQEIPAAPEGMQLPPAKAHYPVPATHDNSGWITKHGAQASRTACATCHTRNDCQSCHLEPLPKQVASMPTRQQSTAPGVRVKERPPDSHSSMFFLKTHSTLAASDPKQCATCHVESFCVSCHDGPSTGGYHPAGFVAKHAAAAWGRDVECANCHNVTVFCRACHQESGLTAHGRLGPGYHDSEPLWLLRHGQAAREGLESCTSCHKQTDCTQCHSVLGAFKVSPHGRDFDAARAYQQNPRACSFCHIGNPLDGGGG